MLTRDQLNNSLFVGVDTHKYEHTGVAANRFEEELGIYQFGNTCEEIDTFIQKIEALSNQTGLKPTFGIEGSGGSGALLTKRLLSEYTRVYEVNPVLTQSRREHSTRQGKSDKIDAGLVVSVLTRDLASLPQLSAEHTHNQGYLIITSLVKLREDLVKERTRLKNQLHHLFHKEDPRYRERFNTVFSQKALAYWQRRCYRDTEDQLIKVRRRSIAWKIKRLKEIFKQIGKLEKKLTKIIDGDYAYLLSLPGVGVVNAAKLVAEVKNINRFSSVDAFTRYIGCVPEQDSSGKRKNSRKAKMSRRALFTTVHSIILTQLRVCAKAKSYYEKKLAEGKTKKQAQRALMKRVGSIIYGMMKAEGEYRG